MYGVECEYVCICVCTNDIESLRYKPGKVRYTLTPCTLAQMVVLNLFNESTQLTYEAIQTNTKINNEVGYVCI